MPSPVAGGLIVAREKALYEEQRAAFVAAKFDMPGIDQFYWYHTVDIGEGIVTPGDYDYRPSIDAFGFPRDMHGMRVLDVGSATGFFAFEFERRGAEVWSVELPSLYDWGMISGDREKIVNALMQAHGASSAAEAHWRHLDGPFEFCKRQRRSSIKRIFSTVYDLKPTHFDGTQFDLVYLGDILLHLFNPLGALNSVAPLCRGKLIASSEVMGGISEPIMRFVGQSDEGRTWWAFTRSALADMLTRVGFKEVLDVGTYTGLNRRVLLPYERLVMHATK